MEVVLKIETNILGDYKSTDGSEIFNVNENEVSNILFEEFTIGDLSLADEIRIILENENLNSYEKLYAIFKSGLIESEVIKENIVVKCPECKKEINLFLNDEEKDDND